MTKSRGARGKRGKAMSGRSRAVWGSFASAMSVVGGLFWYLQGGPLPRADGLALPALVAADGPSRIEAVFQTRRPLDNQRWKAIVIHHSGSVYGTPAEIAAQHRAMNLDGLGFHFVIGNGSGLPDGEIHVGYRWLDQLAGAHVSGEKGDWYNRNSIGICLVGDGRRKGFTAEQQAQLTQLVGALCDRLGVSADHVYLHSDLAKVDDPGRLFPEAAFRDQLANAR